MKLRNLRPMTPQHRRKSARGHPSVWITQTPRLDTPCLVLMRGQGGDRSLKINCTVVGFGQWRSQSSKKYGHSLVLSLCLLILGDSHPGWQLLLKAHPTNARSYLGVRNLRRQSKAICDRMWRESHGLGTHRVLAPPAGIGHLSTRNADIHMCELPRAVPAITDPPQLIVEDTGDPPGSHSPTAGVQRRALCAVDSWNLCNTAALKRHTVREPW